MDSELGWPGLYKALCDGQARMWRADDCILWGMRGTSVLRYTLRDAMCHGALGTPKFTHVDMYYDCVHNSRFYTTSYEPMWHGM